MADDVDKTAERAEVPDAANIMYIRQKAAMIPKGSPGICSRCEEHSQRLVNGVCAPCRDKFKLP